MMAEQGNPTATKSTNNNNKKRSKRRTEINEGERKQWRTTESTGELRR
jgi:hypothetical protein